jgi:hypothetical protein
MGSLLAPRLDREGRVEKVQSSVQHTILAAHGVEAHASPRQQNEKKRERASKTQMAANAW